VPVFLSTSREIIDIDTELTSQNFDVREHFLSAVPLVLYVKWAFAETCWNAPEANACLVIDDPLLKPRHGFCGLFKELLSLMKRHKFSTNIAFIPWNWRKKHSRSCSTVQRKPRALLTFGSRLRSYAGRVLAVPASNAFNWKAQQALERMKRHHSITGIRHDPVMVFPQGIFSKAAMSALKRTDLIASVNNDIISADPSPRAITVSDVWEHCSYGLHLSALYRKVPVGGDRKLCVRRPVG